MAIQPVSAEITLQSGLGGTRRLVATAGQQDTPAGGSVDVTITQTTSGSSPPASPGTFELIVKNAAGTAIRTFSLNGGVASQTATVHLTSTAASGGAARTGTLELVLRAVNTVVGTVNYNVHSDGTTATIDAGSSITERDRGWIRGSTTETLALSNISAGGAKTEPADYNESIFVRSTFAHDAYVARTLTLGVSDSLGGPAQTGASNSTTAVTRDRTLSEIIDNRYSAALRTLTATSTAPNESLPSTANDAGGTTGAGWTAVSSVTGDTITADPRITIDHHMQVNNNVFDAALDRTSRLTSDLGFATFTALSARGDAISGLVCTHSLRDADNLAAAQFSLSETTQSNGRPSSMQTWDAALPGGAWTHTVTPTTSDATGLGTPTTDTWTLLAASPSIKVLAEGGPAIADRGKHFDGTGTFQTFVGVIDVDIQQVLSSTTTPAVSAATVALFRVNSSGVAQYLNGSNVWTNLAAGVAITFHTCTETAAGSGVFTKAFTADSTWGTSDVVCLGRAVVGGTPYGGLGKEIAVDAANSHAGYALDAVGLALTGGITFR